MLLRVRAAAGWVNRQWQRGFFHPKPPRPRAREKRNPRRRNRRRDRNRKSAGGRAVGQAWSQSQPKMPPPWEIVEEERGPRRNCKDYPRGITSGVRFSSAIRVE